MSNIFDGKAKAITKDIIFNIKENEKINLGIYILREIKHILMFDFVF